MFSFKRVCLGLAFVLSTTAMACSAESADDTAGSEADQTAASGRAEVFPGNDGQHYFRLVAANGEPLLRSAGYANRSNAVEGVDTAIRYAQNAVGYDLKHATSGEYFFNVVAGNHEIVATSQLYSDEAGAKRGVETVKRIAAGRVDRSDAQTGARFDTFKREADSKHFFRLVAANGETVLHSQPYQQSQGVKRGITSIRRNGELAANYEIKQVSDGQFIFLLKAPNNHVIANSELYTRRESAEAGIRAVTELLTNLRVKGEDAENPPAASCGDLPGSYWELYEDNSWRAVSRAGWELGSTLDDLQQKQLFAAVGVGDRDDVTTVEQALDNVDMGEVNYTVLEKAGKRYIAVEYGAGDNSYGGIFAEGSATLLAGIHDGDIYCER
jgi:hypothetical protein